MNQLHQIRFIWRLNKQQLSFIFLITLKMEEVLIYDLQSQNSQVFYQKELKPSKISSKETQSQQILATKMIKVLSEQSPKTTQYPHENIKVSKTQQENIIFYEENLSKSNSSIDMDQSSRKFLKRKFESEQQYSDQYEDQVQQLQKLNQLVDQEESSYRKRKIVPEQTTLTNKTIIVTANVDLLIRQVVPQGYKITCFLQVKKNLLGFSGLYRLFLGQERQFLLAAKKEKLKYYSNFLLSKHPNEIHKRSQIYVGRLESNFVGTEFKLFSVKQQFQSMKLLINYSKNIVGIGGLRRLRAIKLNPDYKKHKYFSTLSSALQRNEKSQLTQLSTAQPTLKKGKYRLDFKGKVKVPSSKNFILNDDKRKQCLLFGKLNESEYIVQVSYPLTILQAFGVSLSSLDSKLMVN